MMKLLRYLKLNSDLINKILFIILLIIPLVIVLVWFHQGGIIAGGEEGLPIYNSHITLKLSDSLWVPIETGLFAIDFYPRLPLALLYSSLNTLHISSFLFQAGMFYILMAIGMISTFALVLYLTQSKKYRHTSAFASSVFYFLNPYSMTQVWQRGLYAQYFMFALLPLAILLFAYGLDKKKYIYIYLLIVVSFIFSTAFGLVTNIIVFWSVIMLYFIVYIYVNKNNYIFAIRYIGLCLFLWSAANAWWFLPLLIFNHNIFSGKAGNIQNNLSTLVGVSQYFPFPTIIRLMQDFFFVTANLYGKSYTIVRFEILSWIPPVLLIIGLLITSIKYFIYTKNHYEIPADFRPCGP